jgi:hypothetical protein
MMPGLVPGIHVFDTIDAQDVEKLLLQALPSRAGRILRSGGQQQ